MFIIWGSDWKYKTKVDGLRVEKFCPECDMRGEFFEVIPTKYFTLFWISLAPTQTKKPLLECPNCHERFYIQQADYLSGIRQISTSRPNTIKAIPMPQTLEAHTEACIAVCDRCGQKLKLPNDDRMLKATCPSCRNTFDFQNSKKI